MTPNLCFRLALALTLLAGPMLPDTAWGQAAAPEDDEAAVLEAEDRLLDGMRDRDGTLVDSAFHSHARLARTGVEDAGILWVVVEGVDRFVTTVGAGGEPLNEVHFDPEVRVDGDLAHVWTYYRFYSGDELSRCGHNSIQLVRTSKGWKILSLAYTDRMEECDP